MRLSDFDYPLPEELIAQYPCEKREEARLLVVNRADGSLGHDTFRNIGRYLPAPSLLVVNNSRVIPARLLGRKPRTGGEVEVFLLRQVDGQSFEAMLRPLKKIREGEPLEFPGGLRCVLVDRERRLVRFDCRDVLGRLEESGHIPLPPYIKRSDDDSDRINYQTVYAKRPGSVAAPTAGLHFSKPLIASLKKAGHAFAEVTLHVNYGTFKPVECEDVTQHKMHSETYSIPPVTLRRLLAERERGGKVVAVGTTSCRTLEAWARTGRTADDTDIFIYPGGKFQVTDALVTNFHLPRSTLLMLVCAFAGTDLIRRAYAEAVREKYRFYSYGDAMVIV
ncbi:MAG: tRNA preQ1(34) S-adenosylmethionine ribosyltransferase-isomerase QueA [Candidatus Omnitrophica bacterium]|nr:tRNA preQ1(34) S-adenosylmethionine ribosyltransferase-isomerase QueA [Candidatus Omnitrophota bacterium]